MSFNVEQLISERGTPITIRSHESLKTAVELMIEHDYSQLPVVDEAGRVLGMVTSDSILRALAHFGTTVDGLRVSHALTREVTRVRAHFRQDDVFDLLDDLKEDYAVPIVDEHRRVVGIVTSYDTTEFFRSRAADVMYVEDIEASIREYINAAYTGEDGVVNEEARDAAVARRPWQLPGEDRFIEALRGYLEQTGMGGSMNEEVACEHFRRHLARDEQPKSFDRLDMSEYIALLLRKETWASLQSLFQIDKPALRKLLDGVREIRNKLFHFRGEITAIERSQLRFCSDWLGRQKPPSPANSPERLSADEALPVSAEDITPGDKRQPAADDAGSIRPVEDLESSDSRYAALATFLRERPDTVSDVTLCFEDVEAKIGGPLPAFARQHRSWWANDSVSHPQSLQWLEAGWRVRNVNISEERVVFTRNREREHRYIHFFSGVIADLTKAEAFPLKNPSPNGQSWQIVAVAPRNGPAKAVFTVEFTARSQFRAGLYIDTQVKASTKQVFDHLYARRGEIEATLGIELEWLRLDSRRASRIALARDGSITQSDESLRELRSWAVEVMPRLHGALSGPLDEVLAHL